MIRQRKKRRRSAWKNPWKTENHLKPRRGDYLWQTTARNNEAVGTGLFAIVTVLVLPRWRRDWHIGKSLFVGRRHWRLNIMHCEWPSVDIILFAEHEVTARAAMVRSTRQRSISPCVGTGACLDVQLPLWYLHGKWRYVLHSVLREGPNVLARVPRATAKTQLRGVVMSSC